jgi:hypothetical protein
MLRNWILPTAATMITAIGDKISGNRRPIYFYPVFFLFLLAISFLTNLIAGNTSRSEDVINQVRQELEMIASSMLDDFEAPSPRLPQDFINRLSSTDLALIYKELEMLPML